MTDRFRFWTWLSAAFNALLYFVSWIGNAIKYTFRSGAAFILGFIALFTTLYAKFAELLERLINVITNADQGYEIDTIIGVGQSAHMALINQYIFPITYTVEALAFLVSTALLAITIKVLWKVVQIIRG